MIPVAPTLPPRLRPSQRDTAGSDPGIHHRSRHQPRGAYTAGTADSAAHGRDLGVGVRLVDVGAVRCDDCRTG